MQSILSDGEVSSGHPRITAKKGYNFLSDRWIALKCLQGFRYSMIEMSRRAKLV